MAAGLLMAGAGFVAGCGDATTSPSVQPIPTPTPTPAPPNSSPRIVSLTLSSPRVEADLTVTATAVVEDAETPIDQLVYEWTVTPSRGTLTLGANARQVVWTSPHAQPSPDIYTITLNVTENYTAGGQPKQNKADPKSVQLHYNDSYAEIKSTSGDFLNDFMNISVSPEQCVRNFSDNCPGKADELSDITGNRKNFQILGGQISLKDITLGDNRTAGTAIWACTFQDIPNGGVKENVPGICTLTAVYENWTWLLCTSTFDSTGPATPASLRYRVPGQIVSSGRRPLQ